MKIYVASSWRNTMQPSVVRSLRDDCHEVFDFREPEPGHNGFHWSDVDPLWKCWSPKEFRHGLEHDIARAGFDRDMGALEWCEVCVLVLPCGRSSHLELGWAAGARKSTIILLEPGADPEAELMYLMANKMCVTMTEVLIALRDFQMEALEERLRVERKIADRCQPRGTFVDPVAGQQFRGTCPLAPDDNQEAGASEPSKPIVTYGKGQIGQ